MSNNHLDIPLTSKAINALFKYEEKKRIEKGKVSILGYYSNPVLAQIQLTAPIKKAVIRPVRVKIPHSIFSVDGEDHTICLFCRSEDKKDIEEHVSKNPIEGLTKILSINDVRKLYVEYKSRKQLLKEHTHFVCDTRILKQLYNLLGKVFGDRNHHPVPIIYRSVDNIRFAIEKVISSSFMHLKGSVISIRLGHTGMNISEVTANVIDGIEFAISKFPNVWKSVKSIHLKTADSPALPIYSKLPSEEFAFVMKKLKDSENSTPDSPKTTTAVVVVEVVKSKGKKRSIKDLEQTTSSSIVSTVSSSVTKNGKKNKRIKTRNG